MRPFTRRHVLALPAALLATQAAHARPASEVDVAVIGAGAAGIAAARAVLAAGRSCVVLEASSRIGGRARTDTSLFGVPSDLGAHWMHAAATNPLVPLAKAGGFALGAASDVEALDIGGRRASAEETSAFGDAYGRAEAALEAAAERGRDIACAEALPDLGAWRATIEFLMGPYDAARDLDDLSVLDWAAGPSGEDLLPHAGYGAVLASLASDLPITTGTPVTEVDLTGRDIRLTTGSGTVRARSVVLTASTNVLASGKIRFKPGLPPPIAEAAATLTLGTYNHVILEIPDDPLGLGPDGALYFKVSSPLALGILGNASGTALHYCDIGGRVARELEEESETVALAFVRDFLAERYGGDFVGRIGRTHVTTWGLEPYVLGAYSAAPPGGFRHRAALREPIGDRLFLAGEASSETAFATVHGAWQEGERAARQALTVLRG